AAVLYGPLQEKLRSQSIENLRDAVLNSRGAFTTALGKRIETPKNGGLTDPDTRPAVAERRTRIGDAALDLRQRIDARVLVDADDSDGAELPEFFYDSDFAPASADAVRAALQADCEDQTITRVSGDQVTVAVRL